MAACPSTLFEASGTDQDKEKARRKAFQNAQKVCEFQARGCPLPDVKHEIERHIPGLGWTIELRFKCQQGL